MAVEDSERCEISPYLHPAHSFIDASKYRGRVLIADSGVSRSGAVAITYMMRNGTHLLEVNYVSINFQSEIYKIPPT